MRDHCCPARASVIVVTYDSRADIDACLHALEEHSPDAEIVVVDNQSSDGTLAHVRRRYPHLRAVTASRNAGFGAGANLGATLAHGDYLAILNPDTVVEPGWLDALVGVLECRPDVGLVTSTVLLMGSDDRVNARGNDVHVTGLAFCAGLDEVAPPITAAPRPVGAISGAAFAVRRNVWEQLGGFDERFFMYLEDTDLSLRARRLGYTILHVPASRVWHRYRVQVSATKLYHLERNRLLMLRKNFSPATLAMMLPALMLTEALVWAFCFRSGKGFRRAKWAAYRRLWAERHSVELAPHAMSIGQADRDVLRALGARLALELLQGGAAAGLANLAFTPYFAVWRALALARTR